MLLKWGRGSVVGPHRKMLKFPRFLGVLSGFYRFPPQSKDTRLVDRWIPHWAEVWWLFVSSFQIPPPTFPATLFKKGKDGPAWPARLTKGRPESFLAVPEQPGGLQLKQGHESAHNKHQQHNLWAYVSNERTPRGGRDKWSTWSYWQNACWLAGWTPQLKGISGYAGNNMGKESTR